MKKLGLKLTFGALAVCAAMVTHAQTDVIKIGVNQPLTGVVAAAGNFVTSGAKIAADEINEKGGVLGKKLVLVIEDNKSNPTEAANATEKLIVRDKVPVLMGAWSSTYTLASMPKLMEYKVPMVVETSSSSKITSQGNPYVFRISPTSAMEAVTFARHIKPLNIRKADVLVVNNDWGLGSATAYGDVLKQHGATVGKVQTMDAAAQDMSSQLSSIKASDADTLIVTTGAEQTVLVLKQAQALGLNKQIITTGGNMPEQLIAQAGSAADGTMHVMMFVPWFPEATPDPEAAKKFISEWNERKLDPAGMPEGSRGYDGIHTIAAAIEKAGSAEPAKILDALWKTEINGLTGKVAFHKEGPKGRESAQSTPTTYLVKIEDGKVAYIP
jgi:branched-chain amino acid transport system substrate-binding protein